eukprot:690235-Alexandrium_andersonii.AAC.1
MCSACVRRVPGARPAVRASTLAPPIGLASAERAFNSPCGARGVPKRFVFEEGLSLIHISEPTRLALI